MDISECRAPFKESEIRQFLDSETYQAFVTIIRTQQTETPDRRNPPHNFDPNENPVLGTPWPGALTRLYISGGQGFPDPRIHARVTAMLQDPILQGLNLPPYPLPVSTTYPIVQIRDEACKTEIVTISQRLHHWTRIFQEGPIEFNLQCLRVIKTYLKDISNIDSTLWPTFIVENMNMNAIVRFISADRRLFVEHILALHIYSSILQPFYVGIDVNVSILLFLITDKLHRDRKSFLNTASKFSKFC